MFKVVALACLVASSSACSATTSPPASATAADASGAPGAPGPSAGAEPADSTGSTGAPGAATGVGGGSPTAPPSTLAAGDSKEDAHWVQADDYFVGRRAYEKGMLAVHLGKMKTPPSADAKGAALFFIINDGSEERSAHFYRTRPAVKADLVLGNLLICFDDNWREKVYRAPRNKDNARPGGWWMARITDLSDLEKGYATLSGRYHCAPDALRAIVN